MSPSVNPNHHVGRGVPDVAGDADEKPGQHDFRRRPGGAECGRHQRGGSTLGGSRPRINQQLGKPVGYLTPLLYTQLGKAGVLNDITVGNNEGPTQADPRLLRHRRLGCLHGLGNTKRNEAAGGAGRQRLHWYFTQRAAEW